MEYKITFIVQNIIIRKTFIKVLTAFHRDVKMMKSLKGGKQIGL